MSSLHLKIGLTSILLVGIHLALALLSADFAYERDSISKPILAFVALEILAGAAYLLAVHIIRDSPTSKALLIWVIAIGIALRLALLASTPILEDDYYRYLWDGAVVAEGMNPYAFAPGDVLESDGSQDNQAVELQRLAEESGDVLWRVNHPRLRSIYPPVAQIVFALAHRLGPWSLSYWRLTLFALDAATLILLLKILMSLKLSALWAIVYWWNPLLIKETFNSAHMDVVALPFVLAAILFSIRSKPGWAALFLGLAVGVKIWPVALLPLVLRPVVADPKKLVFAAGLFALVAAAMILPVYVAGFGDSSGFVVYGQRWENNDALFMIFLWGAQAVSEIFDIAHAQIAARFLVALLLVIFIARLARDRAVDAKRLCENALLIVAAIFLLSPAQFPWYYVWMVPFLAIRPRVSLLLLTALLPLYYLRFYFASRGSVGIFDFGIVWLEYLPVWVLLFREWRVERRYRLTPLAEVIA